jgi:transcriptional regulator with XRE-family HTH domain
MQKLDYVRSEMGARLRAERQRLKWTQVELADKIGVKQLTIGQYESGRTSPPATLLHALDHAGADVLFIVTGKRPCPPQGAQLPVQDAKAASEWIERIMASLQSQVGMRKQEEVSS